MGKFWCESCEEKTDHYEDSEGKVRCSICEALVGPQPDEPDASETPEPAQEAWSAAVPPEGKELVQELDHIRLDLQGDFRNADLKGLLDEFKDIEAAMNETGRPLKLIITAIRKSKIKKLRDNGDIVIPFRDRHGNIIPGRALHLPFNKNSGRN